VRFHRAGVPVQRPPTSSSASHTQNCDPNKHNLQQTVRTSTAELIVSALQRTKSSDTFKFHVFTYIHRVILCILFCRIEGNAISLFILRERARGFNVCSYSYNKCTRVCNTCTESSLNWIDCVTGSYADAHAVCMRKLTVQSIKVHLPIDRYHTHSQCSHTCL
jgi:hypothetical protein